MILCIFVIIGCFVNAREAIGDFGHSRIKTIVTDDQFPQVVSLQHHGNKSHFCGGTILSHNLVLTAAHCLDKCTAADINIVSSTRNLNEEGRTYKAKRFILHEDFDVRNNYNNDIALIKVKPKFNLKDGEAKIKLPTKNQVFPSGTKMTVVGWGRISQYETSSKLRKLDQRVMGNYECSFLLDKVITEGNICAATPQSNMGFCKGDSGGPVFVNDTQVGVVSWYVGRCGAGPSVYVKLSHYMDWISANIGLNLY